MDTAESCLRKWAWDKIEHVPRTETEAAKFGTEGHRQAENWLKLGVMPDLTTPNGQALMAGLHHLPRPGTPGMVVEEPFLLQAWGYYFLGIKDIEITGPGMVPQVWDHKFTKDFQYAKTLEQLRFENIQSGLYSAEVMLRTNSDVCDLNWIYYKSKKPYKSEPRQVRVSRADVTPTLERIKGIADTLVAIKDSGLRALDLPPNPVTCDAYGGCPYKSKCNLTETQKVIAIMTQANVTNPGGAAFLNKVRALAAANGAGAGVAVNQPPQPQGVPAGAQVSPDGAFYLDTASNSWVAMPAQAPQPPPAPAPPPPPAPAPPPPPAPAPPPPPAPAGPQLSPDGQWQMVNGAWIPYQAPAAPAKRGRPRKNQAAPPAPGQPPPVPGSDPEQEALMMLAEGLEMCATAIRNGALD